MVIKRIVIIFVIVGVLLSFGEISCLAQENRLSWGEFWNKCPDFYKLGFIHGVEVGMLICSEKVYPMWIRMAKENLMTQEETKRKEEIEEFIDYFASKDNTEKIARVMDDLYKDPANTEIYIYVMTEIAYQKLKGEDIEPLLQEARKRAFQYPWR